MRLTRRIALPTGLEICLSMRPAPASRPDDRPEGSEGSGTSQAETPATGNMPPADIG